ncbi:SRPBCC family protein [Nocardioides sp.]|uniref:SRPBCC family protein n=1 Tax=Nocardioides sp. TaxID=35761 RepID=UPI0039E25D22
MELTHRFTVPGSVEETWDRFQDIASLAECFPGAQVTSAEGDSFEGTVKVKLGPIALVYAGSGTFTEKDAEAHRFVVDAKGRDKRGNGTAGATVTVSMSASGDATDVEVATDLSITGKPAQFGRGVMQDVSDKLLQQFVACLEAKSAPGQDVDAGPEEAAEELAVSDMMEEGGPVAAPSTGRHAAPATPDDAIDLGTTVLPVLAKGYWKQAAAGVVVLAALVWLLRRLTR